jgi:hypothetical protein
MSALEEERAKHQAGESHGLKSGASDPVTAIVSSRCLGLCDRLDLDPKWTSQQRVYPISI